MAVVTNPTSLTVVGPGATPAGATFDEQACDNANGNAFVNAPGTLLYMRNGNAGTVTVTFYADKYGDERIVLGPITLLGSATETGVQIMGPFPAADFNDHGTTHAASAGKVIFKVSSASVLACPLAR